MPNLTRHRMPLVTLLAISLLATLPGCAHTYHCELMFRET